MKRREFLIRAGAASVIVPGLARAADPCPPPTLAVEGGTSVSTACEAAPAPGSAPSWFLNMQEGTWATPVRNTLDSVKPNPLPSGNDGHAGVCNNWSGGTADQDRGEFVLAANGGHQGYSGNEVYVCPLREDAPAWRRITDPSPPSAVSSGTFGRNSPARYGDGRPSSSHTYNRPCWGNGKVWLPGIDSEYSAAGWWSSACYSFERASQQWAYHGLGIKNPNPSDSYWKWLGGSSAYDRVAKRVWSVAQFAFNNGVYSVNAETGAITEYDLNVSNFGYSWSVIAHDLRLWIVGTPGGVFTLDLNNPSAGFTRRTTQGTGGVGLGVGAVYHQPSRAILTWHGYGAAIRKLAIPLSIGSTWTWSEIAPAAGNSVTPTAAEGNGTYGRFNMIEDMGNGRSALCIVNKSTGPTFVYKLPARV